MVGFHSNQDSVQQRLVIFQPVRFIHNYIGPYHSLKEASILWNHLIICENNIEWKFAIFILTLKFPDNFSGLRGTNVGDTVHLWCPLIKLLLPCSYGRQRHTNQHRTIEIKLVPEIFDESNSLNGFSKSHFIGQNYTVVFVPGSKKKVNTIHLIISESKVFISNEIGLFFHRAESFIVSFHPIFVIIGILIQLPPFLIAFQHFGIIFLYHVLFFPCSFIIRKIFPLDIILVLFITLSFTKNSLTL